MFTAGIILITLAVLSWFGQIFGFEIPVAHFFAAGGAADGAGWLPIAAGHVLRAAMVAAGIRMVIVRQWNWNPQTLRKWKRFRSIRRGHVSLIVLGALVLVAALDTVLVGKRALIVKYNGQWHFPFLHSKPIKGATFGMLPAESETDYRKLQRLTRLAKGDNWVLMPLVPYDARSDTPPVILSLEQRAGDQSPWYAVGEERPFTGLAYTVYKSNPDLRCREVRFKNGIMHGDGSVKDEKENLVSRLKFEHGKQVSGPAADTFAAVELPGWQKLSASPNRPSWETRHFLGTDSNGSDIVAVLYGAFQLIILASVCYVAFTYLLGILTGCVMGFFGGLTDLIGQRFVEIWACIPFIYVVVLIRNQIDPTVVVLVGIMAAFDWMTISAYMRSGSLREKERDYVAAARLMGAGTGRIIFRHIVPNLLSTLITMLPFKVNALIFGLTSLDYLGFGLRTGEPSWGVLLKDGTGNLHAPWIVFSAFGALATILILVTFVGEALREAFDPKKFTYYR